MSLYTELARLDVTNKEHVKLAEALARAKAKHDVLRDTKHRKDPSLLAALIEYRKARQAVRIAGEEALNEQTPI